MTLANLFSSTLLIILLGGYLVNCSASQPLGTSKGDLEYRDPTAVDQELSPVEEAAPDSDFGNSGKNKNQSTTVIPPETIAGSYLICKYVVSGKLGCKLTDEGLEAIGKTNISRVELTTQSGDKIYPDFVSAQNSDYEILIDVSEDVFDETVLISAVVLVPEGGQGGDGPMTEIIVASDGPKTTSFGLQDSLNLYIDGSDPSSPINQAVSQVDAYANAIFSIPSRLGRGFGFDGLSSVIQVNNFALPSESFTIAFWCLLPKDPNKEKEEVAKGAGCEFHLAQDKVNMSFNYMAQESLEFGFTTSDGKLKTVKVADKDIASLQKIDWHHFVFSYKSETGILNAWIDNQNVNYKDRDKGVFSSLGSQTGSLVFGRNWRKDLAKDLAKGADIYSNAYMDEFAIWGRALAPEEINYLYQNELYIPAAF